eukprot:9467367-Pyramimonas_sp.AAC.1
MAEKYPNVKVYGDKTKGELSHMWKPLVRVDPRPGEEAPVISFARANCEAAGVDVDFLRSCFNQALASPAENIEWSI